MLISQVTKPFNMKKINFQLISIKSVKAYSAEKKNYELLYNLNFPENGSSIYYEYNVFGFLNPVYQEN